MAAAIFCQNERVCLTPCVRGSDNEEMVKRILLQNYAQRCLNRKWANGEKTTTTTARDEGEKERTICLI